MPDEKSKIELTKEENAKKRKNYHRTPEQGAKLAFFDDLFLQDRLTRDEELKRYLNERELVDYLDDNQKRINGYVEPRMNAEDWQVRYRNLLTRNKFLAFLSKLAAVRMKFTFKNKTSLADEKRLKIFNALYNHYEDLDDGDMKQFMAMWNAWQDGTVVDWSVPDKKTKKMKNITNYDAETGESTGEDIIIKTWKVISRLIPLQDLWVGNVRLFNQEQEQPHMWLRFVYTYQDFMKDWEKFPNAEYVPPIIGEEDDDDTFYRENNVNETDKVELLWYMNKWEDRMIIWGNQVELYDGPMPYMDSEGKFYPVTIGVIEPIATDIYIGKSGADKLKRDQDLIDLFYRKIADRAILISDPPIFSEGNEDLPEKVSGKPGHTIPVNNLAGIREFVFQNNQNEIVNALKVFTDSADLTSLSSADQGASQPNRTATADVIAQNATKQLVGLSQFFMENFFAKKALVKAKHILQGMDTPEKIRATIRDGVVEKNEMDWGVFTEKNIILDDGSRGDVVYKVVGSPEDLPSQAEIDMQELVAQKKGFNVQYKYLTTDYFDGLLLDIEPVAGSSIEQSPALKRTIETEFQKGFATFFPEIYMQNQTEFAKDYVEVYEKEVDKLVGQGAAPVPQELEGVGVPGGQKPPAPGGQGKQNVGVPREIQNQLL